MMRPALTLLVLVLSGCVGEAEFQLGGAPVTPEPVLPGGEKPVQVGTFQGLSEGLPPARLGGTAQLDGALYAVASEGLYRLPTGSKTWEAVALGTSKATSVSRLDTALWVTTLDGVWRLGLGDDAFGRVAGSPFVASHALVRKGSELLLATSSGLLASSDRGATWTTRSTAAPFTAAVTALVASPAATRIFALQGTKLWHSDDAGATWASGLVGGEVKAIGAEAEVVLLQTSNGALRSENYGNTFYPLDVGATAQSFAASGKRAFAGTMMGMRVSDDSGKTWRDSSAGLPAGVPVMQLFLAGGSLVASTGDAVYVATVQ